MDWAGFLGLFGVMFVLSLILISLNYLLGPKTPETWESYPYECGVPLYDNTSQTTFHQGYYMLGLLLILFDIEAAFLFPWASIYRFIPKLGFVEVFLFLLILTLGLVYAYKKGALDWHFDVEEL